MTTINSSNVEMNALHLYWVNESFINGMLNLRSYLHPEKFLRYWGNIIFWVVIIHRWQENEFGI